VLGRGSYGVVYHLKPPPPGGQGFAVKVKREREEERGAQDERGEGSRSTRTWCIGRRRGAGP